MTRFNSTIRATAYRIPKVSKKQRARLDAWGEASARRLEFTGNWCERDAPGCTSRAMRRCHHRRLKAQAHDNSFDNALAVCWSCHRWIHSHVAESIERGDIIDTEHANAGRAET